MKTSIPQPQARLWGRAGESVPRGDRRERELEFGSSFPPLTARPQRRRDHAVGWRAEASPLRGVPKEGQTQGNTLTPPRPHLMTPAERRFAPTSVRQRRNAVRHGLEQVSDSIGIRTCASVCSGWPGDEPQAYIGPAAPTIPATCSRVDACMETMLNAARRAPRRWLR